MAYGEIIDSKEARIATTTLNRPDKRNAMSQELMREFDLAVEEFNHDDDARVLVIRGAGRARDCARHHHREGDAGSHA